MESHPSRHSMRFAHGTLAASPMPPVAKKFCAAFSKAAFYLLIMPYNATPLEQPGLPVQ